MAGDMDVFLLCIINSTFYLTFKTKIKKNKVFFHMLLPNRFGQSVTDFITGDNMNTYTHIDYSRTGCMRFNLLIGLQTNI